MHFSKMASSLVSSEIIRIASEVNALKKSGKIISNLTIGDFASEHYPIPDTLREEIGKAYKEGFTNYPPSAGLDSICHSISRFVKSVYDLDYTPDEVQVSGGSRPLIYSMYLAILDEGDKVVFPVPSWNNNHYCHLTGAQAVKVHAKAENNFLPTAADLKPHLKGAHLVSLCSPLNPTGTMFKEQDLKEISELILEENHKRKEDEKPLYLLYDQIYSLLTFGGYEHFNPVHLVPEMKEFTVNIDGASKGFASTGVRVGWAFGAKPVIHKMRAIISHMGAWAPTPEQNAMAHFLDQKETVEAYLTVHKGKLQKSLEALYHGVKQLASEGLPVDAINPMGAIYLTLKLDIQGKTTPDGELLDNSMKVTLHLIKEAGLAIVPFTAFGDNASSPWFRASVGACSFEEIEQVIPRLKECLTQLRESIPA